MLHHIYSRFLRGLGINRIGQKNQRREQQRGAAPAMPDQRQQFAGARIPVEAPPSVNAKMECAR
jgi:hypothetical protein